VLRTEPVKGRASELVSADVAYSEAQPFVLNDGRLLLVSHHDAGIRVWSCDTNARTCAARQDIGASNMNGQPSMLALDDTVVVAWCTGDAIRFQLVSAEADGGSPRTVAAGNVGQEAGGGPGLTRLPDGGFVVSWAQGSVGTHPEDGAYVRVYDTAGDPQGAPIRLHPMGAYTMPPTLVPVSEGSLLVTWGVWCTRCDQEPWDKQVMSRTLHVATSQLGRLTSTPEPYDTGDGAAVVGQTVYLSNGSLLRTWSPDGRGGDLYGQVFDRSLAPVGAPAVLARDPNLGSGFAVASQASGDVLIAWVRKQGRGAAVFGKRVPLTALTPAAGP
jgi:hypothetical protein